MSRIICIDVGHCETAASTVKQENGSNKSARMQMDGNNNLVVSSAVTLSFDQMKQIRGKAMTKELLDSLGTIEIGNSVSSNPNNGEYFIYFKCWPEKFDAPCGASETARQTGLTHGKVMAIFIYQIVKNLLMYNEEFEGVDFSEIQLLVGCPATRKWTDESNKERYAELIQKATGAEKVTIMPESRAAMFSSIEKGQNRFSAANGVLVFDFGSSTADCTYMLLGRKIDEFSWDLGASMIEQQMMLAAYENCKKLYSSDIRNLQLISPMTSDMLRSLRKAKEDYYLGNERKTVCVFVDSTGEEFDVIQKEDKKLMEEVTARYEVECECDSKTVMTGSWRALCKRFFQEAKKRLDREKLPCSAIILTGGASRMDFIKVLCREVFPEAEVYTGGNPSYSVSSGLGWAAVADERYSDCLEEAQMDLKNSEKGNFSSLEEALKEKLREHMCDVIKKCTKQWADRNEDSSADDLGQIIRVTLGSDHERQYINQIIRDEINTWKSGFKEEVQKAVNKQASKLFSPEVAQGLILSDEVWEQLQADSVNVNIDIEKMLSNLDLSGILNKIIQQIVYWTVAFVVASALQIIPVVNLAIGALAGWLASLMVSDTNRSKKRTSKERKRIAGKMDQMLARNDAVELFESSVSDGLKTCKEDFDRIAGNTLTTAFDIITLRRFQI